MVDEDAPDSRRVFGTKVGGAGVESIHSASIIFTSSRAKEKRIIILF
jgi:hypothetical protein